MAAAKSISFEVFGKVQGVFFRKHTKRIAIDLKLVGWVMNTNENTVVGCVQGPLEDIDKMKRWLKYEGSPKSRIDKCIFKDEKEVQKFDYKDFVVRK
ncbi:acylphosphatase-1-like [Clytia hemisphaerica]